jgi:hypothetical protein
MEMPREICEVVAHKALSDHKDVGAYVASVHAKVQEHGHEPVFNLAVQLLREFLEYAEDDSEDTKIMLLHARNFGLAAACMVYESMVAAQEVQELNQQPA